MDLTNFRQRIKNNKMVSIHVMNKKDAFYIENILYKYGYHWYGKIKLINELNISEIVLDVNYDEKNVITYSEEPDDSFHNTDNIIFFSSENIKLVEGLFNINYLKPTYKPKKIERSI